jgi:hypothetical protein
MGKGGRTEKVNTATTSAPDAASQAYIDQLRKQGQTAAGVATGGGPFFTGEITPEQIQAAMNPYLGNVVDATRGEFDQLRSEAQNGSNQDATQAGAFGGSRAAVASGARLGALDRAQMSTIAQLLQGGYGQALDFAGRQQQLRQQQLQEPLFRQANALQFMNLGMGPVGFNSTSNSTTETKNKFDLGQAVGLGLTAFGLYQGAKNPGANPAASGFATPPPLAGFPPGGARYTIDPNERGLLA